MSNIDPWEIRTILADALNQRVDEATAIDQAVSLILTPLSGADVSDVQILAEFIAATVSAVQSEELEIYEGYRRLLKCQMSATFGLTTLRGFLAAYA